MFVAAAIGVSYPIILSGMPNTEQDVIPYFAEKWHIGKGAELNPSIQYEVETKNSKLLATFDFVESTEHQNVKLSIHDLNTGQQLSETISLSSGFTFEKISPELRPYAKILDETVLSTRDLARDDRYLVVGAEWGTMFIGKHKPKVVLTEITPLNMQFGKIDTFQVSYDIGEKQNTFWIVDNVPLPIKAINYDFDGNFVFSYEVVSLSADDEPWFT